MGLFIRVRSKKCRDGTEVRQWDLAVDQWKGGEYKRLFPPRHEYQQYGLDPSDSVEVAREKIKFIQARDRAEKLLQKRARIDQRLKEEDTIESAWLPLQVWRDFEQALLDRYLWTEIPPKTQSHLRALRRMVREIDADPSQWPKRAAAIYRWFLTNKLSLSYVEKLIPLLNFYGYLYCEALKKPFIQVPAPRGKIASEIDKVNRAARGGKQDAAEPLTRSGLESLDLKDPQNRWMRVTFWFGLRPEEADTLQKPQGKETWKTSADEDGTPVLHVYQSKLVGVEPDRRWKRIPAIAPEQRALLIEVVNRRPLRRPLCKTLQKQLGEGYGLYSGRKGFEQMMRADYGQDPINISRWLGHQNINMTRAHYEAKDAVYYTPLTTLTYWSVVQKK